MNDRKSDTEGHGSCQPCEEEAIVFANQARIPQTSEDLPLNSTTVLPRGSVYGVHATMPKTTISRPRENNCPHPATPYNALRHTATQCNTMQHTTAACNIHILQHGATTSNSRPNNRYRPHLLPTTSVYVLTSADKFSDNM